MNVCPAGAIHLTKDGVFVDMERCISCGKCVENCCSEALHTKSAEYTMEELMDLLKKDRQYYDSSGGGITLSGGEVLAHGTHALKIAENARKEGISVAIETSGYGDYEKLYSLARICDWILFDLKHMDAVSHKTYVGASPERIWENLRRLAAVPGMGEKIIIRVPMIHPVNDTVENIQAIGEFMRQNHLRTIHLLPYHDMGIAKAREMGIEQKRFETPSDEVLEAAAKLLRSYGLTAEIMGKEAV